MKNTQEAASLARRSILTLIAAGAIQVRGQQQPARPPAQDGDMVRSFVGLAHNDKNLEKIADMISREPKLVYATWDWGGGDWETGLGGAAHTGSRKMATLLLEKGARIDAYCAAMLGEREVIAAMIKADPQTANARGPHGYTLLYHAASSGDVKMAEILVPHLTDKARDFNQSLSAAVRDNRIAMTAWLLENGVTNANQGDGFGKTPLAVATEKGYQEIAELLRKRG